LDRKTKRDTASHARASTTFRKKKKPSKPGATRTGEGEQMGDIFNSPYIEEGKRAKRQGHESLFIDRHSHGQGKDRYNFRKSAEKASKGREGGERKPALTQTITQGGKVRTSEKRPIKILERKGFREHVERGMFPGRGTRDR